MKPTLRQIIPVSLGCLLLRTPSLAGTEPERGASYTVRLVTFSAPEVEAAKLAVTSEPQNDPALYERMVEQAESGEAEVVDDTLTRSGPGNWTSCANAETPYATEFKVNAKWNQVSPSSFTFRNVGTSVSGKIDPPEGARPAFCQFEWDRVRYIGRRSFPVISLKTSVGIDQPVFFCDKIKARVAIANGQWRLVAMTRPVEKEGEKDAPRHTLLTFLQATDGSEVSPELHPEVATRLHLFAFRTPIVEFMKWALDGGRNDEALLETLLTRAAAGGTIMDSHASCLLSDSGSSEAHSFHEYAYPTDYEPEPSSFTFLFHGHTFELNAAVKGEPAGGIRVKWESMDPPIKELPVSTDPRIWQPEFSREAMNVMVPQEENGAMLTGAVMLPEDEDPGMMHVFFVRKAGPPAGEAARTVGRAEAHAILISLTPTEGARIAGLKQSSKWEGLKSLLDAGSAKIPAWQVLGGMAGSSAAIRRVTNPPEAKKAASLPEAGGLTWASEVHFHEIGSTLKLRLPDSSASRFDGVFKVSLDRPELPSFQRMREAAQKDGALPAYLPAETSFPPRDEKPTLRFGEPQVVALAPCTVPRGNREEGRWHAVVLILRR